MRLINKPRFHVPGPSQRNNVGVGVMVERFYSILNLIYGPTGVCRHLHGLTLVSIASLNVGV